MNPERYADQLPGCLEKFEVNLEYYINTAGKFINDFLNDVTFPLGEGGGLGWGVC
jgi:hypothetical protein